jgi:hypothetical protein
LKLQQLLGPRLHMPQEVNNIISMLTLLLKATVYSVYSAILFPGTFFYCRSLKQLPILSSKS